MVSEECPMEFLNIEIFAKWTFLDFVAWQSVYENIMTFMKGTNIINS
jgi:hypothetical protein